MKERKLGKPLFDHSEGTGQCFDMGCVNVLLNIMILFVAILSTLFTIVCG